MADTKRTLLVCQSGSCLAHGGEAVLAAFKAAELPADVELQAVSCLGQCNLAANARLLPEETWYCRLEAADVERIVREHLHGGDRVEDKLHPRIHRSYHFGLEAR